MKLPLRSAGLLAAATLAVGAAWPQASRADRVRFDREGVLGTSSSIVLDVPGPLAAGVEASTYAEVERLRKILDAYDPKSELRTIPAGRPTPCSAELREVLKSARAWRIESGGAFDPGVGLLDELWRDAEQTGSRPSDHVLEETIRTMRASRWRVEGDLVQRGESAISLDGLAKGLILDRAAAVALEAGAQAVVLEIGGDVIVRGRTARVPIAAPGRSADNAPVLTVVPLADQALATSGNKARGYDVAGRHIGHVLDPRTGRPVEHLLQASVIAPRAVDADALATALLVLPPDTGMPLITAREGFECLLVDREGAIHRSPGWPRSAEGPSLPQGAWPAASHVHLDLEFARPLSAGKKRRSYRRPYVAVWVESQGGAPVRTLCLWIQRERWLKDLRRWYRHHRADRPLIDAVSRPTRKPGQYSLVWDGLDDAGEPVSHGEYTIVIEMAREHGTYQLARASFDTRERGLEVRLDPNPELRSAALRIGPAAPVDPDQTPARDSED